MGGGADNACWSVSSRSLVRRMFLPGDADVVVLEVLFSSRRLSDGRVTGAGGGNLDDRLSRKLLKILDRAA